MHSSHGLCMSHVTGEFLKQDCHLLPTATAVIG